MIYSFLGLVILRGEVGYKEGEQVDVLKLILILTDIIISPPSVNLQIHLWATTRCIVFRKSGYVWLFFKMFQEESVMSLWNRL